MNKYFKKRYLVIALIILYTLFKMYVATTPQKEDDALPELFKDSVIDIYRMNALAYCYNFELNAHPITDVVIMLIDGH